MVMPEPTTTGGGRRAARFAAGFVHLAAYVAEHGTANVPGGHVTHDGFRLGAWVDTKRKVYRAGRLPDEHAALLTALGLDWSPGRGAALAAGGRDRAVRARRTAGDRTSERALVALRSFAAENGHANAPERFASQDGVRAGAWLARQRQARRRGTLRAWVEAALDELGVDWEPRADGHLRGQQRRSANAFTNGFRHYQHFRKWHHRDPRVDERSPDGFRVGRWVDRQRARYRDGQLPPARQAALTHAGICWGSAGGSGRTRRTAS